VTSTRIWALPFQDMLAIPWKKVPPPYRNMAKAKTIIKAKEKGTGTVNHNHVLK
jgi:hypothetical protein